LTINLRMVILRMNFEETSIMREAAILVVMRPQSGEA
jgi:hypothetical protein